MSWDNSKIVLNFSLSGKASNSSPHGVTTVEELGLASEKIKAGSKDHDPEFNLNFRASNGDTQVFNHSAILYADARSMESEEYKAVGTSKENGSIQFKTKGYQGFPDIILLP